MVAEEGAHQRVGVRRRIAEPRLLRRMVSKVVRLGGGDELHRLPSTYYKAGLSAHGTTVAQLHRCIPALGCRQCTKMISRAVLVLWMAHLGPR